MSVIECTTSLDKEKKNKKRLNSLVPVFGQNCIKPKDFQKTLNCAIDELSLDTFINKNEDKQFAREESPIMRGLKTTDSTYHQTLVQGKKKNARVFTSTNFDSFMVKNTNS